MYDDPSFSHSTHDPSPSRETRPLTGPHASAPNSSPAPLRDSGQDTAAVADAVPEDLQHVHRRLLTDGGVWRRNLPSPQGVVQRAQRETGRVAADTRPGRSTVEYDSGHTGVPAARYGVTQPRGAVASTRAPLRTAVGATAALVVVAMLGFLFYGFAHSRGPAVGARTDATPTSGHGIWQVNDALTFATSQQVISGSPAISVSDPNTVYEASLAPLKLRRTTDSGKSWTDLKVPGDTSNVEDFQVFVSPLDAKSVFLTLTTPLPPSSQASACPTLTADQTNTAQVSTGTLPLAYTQPHSGTIPCSLQYHSADGGATWQQVKLPIRAALADLSSDLQLPTTHILRAQGSRLYAAAGCGPLCMGPGDDIVTSTDGGANWTLADSGLRAAGHEVCDFAPSPTGTDVFALTSTQGCDSEAVPPLTLWHSADAGVHWTRVGAPPSNLSYGMAVVSQASGSPLLYIHMPQAKAVPHTVNLTNDPSSLKVSADNGKTWQSAPLAGVPSGEQPSSGPMAVLSDGTEVEVYSTQTATTLYGWKLGDPAWRQVASPLHGQVSQLLVVPQAGADKLIAVTQGGETVGGQQGQNTVTYTVQTYLP